MRYYGWKRPLPQVKKVGLFSEKFKGDLPDSVDLRPQCPDVYDQGQLGSCTANAIAGLYQTIQDINNKLAAFTPSRLFIYYNERALEGTVNTDSGASLTDGMKTVSKQGCPIETLWPYDTSEYTVKPPAPAYDAGLKHLFETYSAVDNTNLSAIQNALALGYPVAGGFTVYESFESEEVAQTGIMPMPAEGEQIVGGHAILIVGYDNSAQQFIIRNSWGSDWGQAGYFMGPYEFFTSSDYADDFWTASLVS